MAENVNSSIMSSADAAPVQGFALLHLGFRPFFLGAMGYAVISMLVWAALYHGGGVLPMTQYPPMIWHAHEMIFGFSMAVVAGFMLTAEKNWTGIQTLHGWPLAALVVVWLFARILLFLPIPEAGAVLAVTDTLFNLMLAVAATVPIVKARQWKHIGLVSKLYLLWLANIAFYLGLTGIWPAGLNIGLFAGLYLVLAIIFTMGRRVIPFFIERGAGIKIEVVNREWIDRSSLVLFLAFAIVDIAYLSPVLTSALALALFVIHVIRFHGWYHKAIWRKPLLWVLMLAYGWLIFGFLLKALGVFWPVAGTLALHSFAVGGIGVVTAGMMARVSLGHTGRNIGQPPGILVPIFALLILAAIFRVILPLLDYSHYLIWISVSQLLWIVAFGILFVVYAPILIRPRLDGRYG